MTVTFKRQRKLSKAENARVRRLKLVQMLSRKPAVGLTNEATEDRTQGKNITIFRTHRKRIRKALTTSNKDMQAIIKATVPMRSKLRTEATRGSLSAYANDVGRRLQRLMKAKILAANLFDTGQLVESVEYKVFNV